MWLPDSFCKYMLISMRRRAQLAFDLRYKGRGGPRKGAGRPRNRPSTVSHLRRPTLSPHHPVHVTLRLVDGLQSLRSRQYHRAVLPALEAAPERDDFRVVEVSEQPPPPDRGGRQSRGALAGHSGARHPGGEVVEPRARPARQGVWGTLPHARLANRPRSRERRRLRTLELVPTRRSRSRNGRHRPPLLRRRPISSRAPADVAVARRADAGQVDVEDYSSKRPFPSRLRSSLLVSGKCCNPGSRPTLQFS